MENLYTTDCIRTHSGRYVNVFEPTLEMFDIDDVSHALSNLPRFGGHLPKLFTVAQHSVLCSYLVPREHAFTTLMHDCSEGYLLDMPSPIKRRMPEYKAVEDGLMCKLAEKFKFEYPLPKEVKEADTKQLQIEWDCLMLGKNNDIAVCWTPSFAKHKFLTRYHQLVREQEEQNQKKEIDWLGDSPDNP